MHPWHADLGQQHVQALILVHALAHAMSLFCVALLWADCLMFCRPIAMAIPKDNMQLDAFTA